MSSSHPDNQKYIIPTIDLAAHLARMHLSDPNAAWRYMEGHRLVRSHAQVFDAMLRLRRAPLAEALALRVLAEPRESEIARRLFFAMSRERMEQLLPDLEESGDPSRPTGRVALAYLCVAQQREEWAVSILKTDGRHHQARIWTNAAFYLPSNPKELWPALMKTLLDAGVPPRDIAAGVLGRNFREEVRPLIQAAAHLDRTELLDQMRDYLMRSLEHYGDNEAPEWLVKGVELIDSAKGIKQSAKFAAPVFAAP